MAENQTKTYADRAPEIPFKLKSFSKEGEKRFAHLINTVADYSETGKSVLETAANEGYQLQMMLMGGNYGFVCPETKTIYLNSAASDGHLIETLVHECRHIQQHKNGIPSEHGEFVLRDAVKLSRAKEADAETMGASAAYEIMINGGGREVWDALTEKAPKITEGLLNAAEREGAPLNHKMMQAAFDGWYQNREIMQIYEDSYLVTQCLGGSCDSRNNPRDYFKREMSSKEMVSAFCLDASGKCYQSGRLNVLDEPERLQVQQKVLDMAERVNGNRRQSGLNADVSYHSLYAWGTAPKNGGKGADKAVLSAAAAKLRGSSR